MKALPLLLCLAALAMPALALAATETNSIADRPVVREAYKLRAGDRIALEIIGVPELRAEGAMIDADGNVTLPGLPVAVRVAGLSVTEAQAVLTGQHRQRGLTTEHPIHLRVVGYAARWIPAEGAYRLRL